jgi:hypothetical protein
MERIPLKQSHLLRLPVSLLMLCVIAAPTHLWAQTTEPAPPANLNSMPKWSEFPAAPANVPTALDFKANVDETQAKGQQLKTETDALVWDDTVAETFAENARERIDPAQSAPIDAKNTPEQIDAMAAELRKRATPPPPIK